MAKAKVKTVENQGSVDTFIDAQKDQEVRDDCRTIIKLMTRATGAPPKMWGGSLIGFGNYVVTSPATGRQVDWFHCGFSPRKANLSLYLMPGSFEKHSALLKKLGPHSLGKGCLYIKRLADVDVKVLEQLVGTLADASVKREKSNRATPIKATKKSVSRPSGKARR